MLKIVNLDNINAETTMEKTVKVIPPTTTEDTTIIITITTKTNNKSEKIKKLGGV